MHYETNLMTTLAGIAGSLGPDVRNTLSAPQEEVIIRYTRGKGRFSQDKRHIALNMKMYRLNGVEDGRHEGVWQRTFDDPREFLKQPPPPTGPMNQPVGPVPHLPVAAHTIARWYFGKGSDSISVAGPASSHLVPLRDGSFVFMVTTAQIITGGTGRYQGAHGLVQSLGSTHIPAGVDLFGAKQVEFEATTFDTFRVLRGHYYQGQQQRGVGSQQNPNQGTQPAGSAPSPDYPFQDEYAEVLGVKMHYIERGQGDPILFIHGNPAWSYLWRNIIPYLENQGHCIAVDLVGMGRSDKPSNLSYTLRDHARLLEAFIRKLNLKNITLVIHDWGSALGFHYAMRYPDNVKGIAFMEALLKPYGSWDEFPASGNTPGNRALRQTFQMFRAGGKGGPGWKAIVDENVFIDKLLPGGPGQPGMAAPVQLTDDVMNYYREPFQTPEHRRVIWQWVHELPIGGEPSDVTEDVQNYSRALEQSPIPKLLIYANPGVVLTSEQVQWCDEHLQNFKKVNIGAGAHFLQESDPAGVGRALSDWYSSL